MKKLLLATVAIGIMSASAYAKDNIQVVGSSTVYPFATTVAEKFGKETGASPVIESTGTGGGIKLFCAGVGEDSPDAVNASRPIKEAEVKTCNENGVNNIVELKIGRDALVLANSKDGPDMDLTIDQVYLALAKQIPIDGKLMDNPHKTWKDVDPSLPDEKIEVLGPPPTSGTRDSFKELVLHVGCKAALKAQNIKLDADVEKAACETVREDGGYVEAGENDNLIVQKLAANPSAVGLFGFSFLENNRTTIKDVKISGVEATYESAMDGSYPISRDLFIYFKGEHFDTTKGLKDFAKAVVSEDAVGEEGYLIDKGLIPLKPDELAKQQGKLE